MPLRTTTPVVDAFILFLLGIAVGLAIAATADYYVDEANKEEVVIDEPVMQEEPTGWTFDFSCDIDDGGAWVCEEYSDDRHFEIYEYRSFEGKWILKRVGYPDPGYDADICIVWFDDTSYEWPANEFGCDFNDGYRKHPDMPKLFLELF
jgi:hypothetical protein